MDKMSRIDRVLIKKKKHFENVSIDWLEAVFL